MKRRRLIQAAALLIGIAAFTLAILVIPRVRLESPPPSFLLHDRRGAFLGEVAGAPEADFGYWPVDPLPPRVVAATLAIEDQRFWQHPGVDPRAVARAMRDNLRTGHRTSGASTLAMQVARMQRPASRTLPSKVLESLTAIGLTLRYPRAEILAHYLRIVPYGNRIHGISYAARRYLFKPVADLSWAEVAFLCALPQAPGRTNPYDGEGRRRAVKRARKILDLLHARGEMTEAERAAADGELLRLRPPRKQTRSPDALHPLLQLTAALRAAPPDDPLITTTLDLSLQEALAEIVADSVDAWSARGAAQGALVVVDRRTRAVRASVGSVGYLSPGGAIDYARTPRRPGSTLKPFLYALALEQGHITPATILDDLQRGPGGIGNADRAFLGPLLPRRALANSRNVPAVQLLADLGLETGYALFRRLNLHDDRLPASHYGLGLAIGGMPVTLQDLVAAYGALASDGDWRPLTWLSEDPGPPMSLLSAATARQIAGFLSDPMARLPTFPRMGLSEYPFPVAVKTGTSTDFRDAWAVGWTERYIVGAWVGHPDARPMKRLSGYRGGAWLVRQTIAVLHPDGMTGFADVGFPPPEGHAPVPLCALTGRVATDACTTTSREWFVEPPIETCAAHRRVLVDRRDGTIATAQTPERFRSLRTFVSLHPRYAHWAAREGLPTPEQPTPAQAQLSVSSPLHGTVVYRDPEIPESRATLPLRATVEPPVDVVTWLVDGVVFAEVEAPYEVRWPLVLGEHVFQVVARGRRSSGVTVVVQ